MVNSISKVCLNEDDAKKLNLNFKNIFKEFNKLEHASNQIGKYKTSNEECRNKRVKDIEVKLQEYCEEIKNLDYNFFNKKLEELEVDNLFNSKEIVSNNSNKINNNSIVDNNNFLLNNIINKKTNFKQFANKEESNNSSFNNKDSNKTNESNNSTPNVLIKNEEMEEFINSLIK